MEERHGKASWRKVGTRRRDESVGDSTGYGQNQRVGLRGAPVLRRNVGEGLREDEYMETCLHRPMNYAKKLRLQLWVGDLDMS